MTTVRSISARSARRKPRLRVNSPKQANHHTDDGCPRKPAIMGTGGRPYRRLRVGCHRVKCPSCSFSRAVRKPHCGRLPVIERVFVTSPLACRHATNLCLLRHRYQDVLRGPLPSALSRAIRRVPSANRDLVGPDLNGHLPNRAAQLVDEWCQLHRAELAADWDLAIAERPLVTIDPLP